MIDPKNPSNAPTDPQPQPPQEADDRPQEVGAKPRLDPVRYGDWELGGRCIDF